MNPEQNTPPPPPLLTPLAEQMTEAEIEALYEPLPEQHALRDMAIEAAITGVRHQIIAPPNTAGGALVSFEDLKELLRKSAKETGSTFAARRDRSTGELVRPESGFACAAGGTEVKEGELEDDVESFLDELLEWHEAVLFLLVLLGVHIGTWKDENGKLEVNITLVFENQRDAERFAMAHDQKAIFDLARKVPIKTGGKGKTHWINPNRNPNP